MLQLTLALIKPDAIERKIAGKIISIIESNGFTIKTTKLCKWPKRIAEEFYAPHVGSDYYEDLIAFMTSGKVMALILEKDNAISEWRNLIGSTDPAKAEDGTIRKLFGTAVNRNVVHGSDSKYSFICESEIIFSELDEN